MGPKDSVTLRGELLSFRAQSDDGWGVGSLELAPANIVAFTGKVLGAKPGAQLDLVGKWVEHPRFGRQFKAVSCVIETPMSEDGVMAWLSKTLPGIGEVRALQLIQRFGGVAKLWETIEHRPGDLSLIDGITAERAQAIHVAYVEHRGTRDNMIALRGWGLTDNQIQKCLDEWKTLDAVCKRIRNNPYQLARYVHGFGFARADEVAKAAGVKHDDPIRIEAGLVHTLERGALEGHVFMWGGALQKRAAEILEVRVDVVGNNIRRASAHGLIVRRGKRIYSAALESLEKKCAVAVVRILATERVELDARQSNTLH